MRAAQGKRLPEWRADLTPGAGGPAARRRPEWLREAYADPAGFWAQAAPELIAEAPGVPRSAVFQWYNLFHELGPRHALGARAAHQDYSPGRGYRAESYAALSTRAHALASAWRARGVVPGAAVCVVLEVSAAYVTCLLAAFCCGATLTVLPPDGPSFVRRALRAVAGASKPPAAPPGASAPPASPVYVVAGTTARPWVEREPGLELLDWESAPRQGDASLIEPHRYDAAEPAARFFSPLSDQWDTPVALSAEQLYLCALRDGLLVFGLEPGQGLAAPGFCEVQFKPALLLAALASGASWVELSLDELEDDRALLDGTVAVLGVSAALERRLSEWPSSAAGHWPRWFKNLAEDPGSRRWPEFERRMKSAGALGMSFFGSSAAGGGLLFSAWVGEPSSAPVYRAPGLPCELSEPNGTGMPALADVGMLSPTELPEGTKGAFAVPASALGQLVIVDADAGDLWVTNLGSHRRGVVLPEAQIEQVLSEALAPAVRAAVLAVLPLAGDGGQRVALIVYARPSSFITAAAVKELLLAELGAERVPDQIEVFELNPKLLDAKKSAETVDRGACRAEYSSGMAWRKSRCPVFQQLAALATEVEAIRAHRQRTQTTKGA